MNYQPAMQSSALVGKPTSTQESVSGVLSQALSQFNDAEVRLIQLHDRIEPRKDLAIPAHAEAPVPGVMTQASLLRNLSARLQGLCSELEAIV